MATATPSWLPPTGLSVPPKRSRGVRRKGASGYVSRAVPSRLASRIGIVRHGAVGRPQSQSGQFGTLLVKAIPPTPLGDVGQGPSTRVVVVLNRVPAIAWLHRPKNSFDQRWIVNGEISCD